ncbi:MAG: hypothetical protein IPQ03_17920 [Bacteroidetes bacterium]|nr:hypothetical protein [Bacteroidota bacterium]MBL0259300.1 hypothetical protein [Bacteroidota bacterium]MBP6401057.1 hypothetical protein [Bacteroidia bacterium]
MDERKSFAERFHFFFNVLMILVYALAGIILIFVWSPFDLPRLNRNILGTALVCYAFWRTYKLVNRKE